MTLVEELHQQHKERLARMGGTHFEAEQKQPVPSQNEKLTKLMAGYAALSADFAVLKRQVQVQSEMLGKLVATEGDDKPRFGEIIDAVCEYYEITKNDVLSSRRTGDLVMPRQIICYLGRHLTGMSFPQMGRRLGGRDHTTALHGANKIQRMLADNETLADDINVLEMKIGAKVISRRFGPNVVPMT
jgi:chromosomal replication initiation ATPase DnaA